MPTITLQLPPGVAKSATPSASPGRWWDSNFVRWQAGGIEPIGGWVRQTSSPLPSAPRAIMPWVLNNNVSRVTAIACDNHLYVDSDGYNDITPVSFNGISGGTGGGYGSGAYSADTYGTARSGVTDTNRLPSAWSLANWGEDLMFVASSDGVLYHWAKTGPIVKAAAVSAAPVANRAMCVTNERSVVLVSGRTVAWSSHEDYTDWNYASTTNTAGFLTLDAETPLVGCKRVKDGVLIFSQSDVWLMRYIGLPFIYGIEKIGSACAPVTPQAVADFEGRACWMGQEGFWLYDGGTVRPLPCEVQDWVFDNNNPTTTRYCTSAGSNGQYPEIWFFYPSTLATENDQYIIFNYVENWWAVGTLGRTCIAHAGVLPAPLMASSDGHIYQHETGYLADGASRVGSVYAETGAMSVGSGEQMMSVVRAQPDSFTGATKTRFKFFTRYTREGTETVHGPYTTRADGYMDVRFQARDVRLRVEATADANWTIGNMRLDAMTRGRR